MFDHLYELLSLLANGIVLGWPFIGNEKPLPALTEPTPWEQRAEKTPIAKFAVSQGGVEMWSIVTEDKRQALFFNKPNGGSTLLWDIRQEYDVPRMTLRTRLVPPRNAETEMTIHAKTSQQFWGLQIPEKEMYRYLLKEELKIV